MKVNLEGSRYCDGEQTLSFGRYRDDSIAITGESPVDGPIGTYTVCLVATNPPPDEGYVYIKTWSEGEGVYEALVKAGIIGEYVRDIAVGEYGSIAKVCPLTDRVKVAVRARLGSL